MFVPINSGEITTGVAKDGDAETEPRPWTGKLPALPGDQQAVKPLDEVWPSLKTLD